MFSVAFAIAAIVIKCFAIKCITDRLNVKKLYKERLTRQIERIDDEFYSSVRDQNPLEESKSRESDEPSVIEKYIAWWEGPSSVVDPNGDDFVSDLEFENDQT